MHYNWPSEDLTMLMSNRDLFAIDRGAVAVPEGTGHGVEIDETAVREMARKPHRWRTPIWRGPEGELREW